MARNKMYLLQGILTDAKCDRANVTGSASTLPGGHNALAQDFLTPLLNREFTWLRSAQEFFRFLTEPFPSLESVAPLGPHFCGVASVVVL